jgi:hypothetical protein
MLRSGSCGTGEHSTGEVEVISKSGEKPLYLIDPKVAEVSRFGGGAVLPRQLVSLFARDQIDRPVAAIMRAQKNDR